VIPAATCSCGARLHATSNHDGNDWVWVDDEGQSLVSRHPPGYSEDPKGWWDRLARENIAAYSDWSARFALGMTGWLHLHTPTHPDRFVGDVPWCCEMPMRLTPRGWVCREMTH
jgi:hypothetical protein